MKQHPIPSRILILVLVVLALTLSACRKDLGNNLPDLNGDASLDNSLPVIELPAVDAAVDAYPASPDLTTLDTTATGEQPLEASGEAVPESAPAQDASTDTAAEQAPAEQPAEQAVDNSAEAPAPAPVEQPVQTTEQANIVHVVQGGETIGAIADRYGVTIDDILAANDIFNINLISIGQELRIESGAAQQVQAQQAQQSGGTGYDPNNYFIHTVGFGDTMFVLAQRYGFTVEELAAYNGIVNYDRIDLNQEIRIPNR